MPFPATFAELASANYHFSGYGICKSCHASIEWWKTPAGKDIPLNFRQDKSSVVVAHHSTCPNVQQFRAQKTGATK